MSDAAYTLLGVLLGGLLTPLTQGVGYYFRRRFELADQDRKERRQALEQLQEAIIALSLAESTFETSSERERSRVHQEMGDAKRRIRSLAARVGDDRLWELVNTPHPERLNEVLRQGSYGEPGDVYDEWNTRIRELFALEPKRASIGLCSLRSPNARTRLSSAPLGQSDTP
jgi:sugar phosphate isomerase/epimerase